MMKVRTSLWASLAIAASLGLAGCGGSSNENQQLSAAEQCTAAGGIYANDTCTTQADTQRADLVTKSGAVTTTLGGLTGTDDDPTPTADQIRAVNTAITALETSISGASALSAGDKAGYEEQVKSAKASVGRAQAARMKADNDAAKATTTAQKKTGEDLFKAIGLEHLTRTNNDDGTTLASGNLTIGLNLTPARTPDPALEAKAEADDSAGKLGDWQGKDYTLTTGTGTDKVVDEARIYHNQGKADEEDFADTLPDGIDLIGADVDSTAGFDEKGALLVASGTSITTGLDASHIKADAFEHSGTQGHKTPDGRDAFYARGTYNGAPGQYRCSGTTCSSTNDGTDDSPSGLAGTWHFKPDANAKSSVPDANYLYFGWWVSKDDKGVPTHASAFAGTVEGTTFAGTGTVPVRWGWDGTYDDEDGDDGFTLTGSAKYEGSAAGKFALSNPFDGTGNGGHFTADAELTAKFSGDSGVGIHGTVDNFRLNDESNDPGWKVDLHRASFGADGQLVTPANDSATPDIDESLGTTWSIGEDSTAARSGTWSGRMYDEAVMGDDNDRSNIPTTVTGTFHSTFGSGSSLVGAFGATR